MWTRSARIVLLSFVVTFAVAVFLGMQQRRGPMRAVAVDRGDVDAVIESRRTRITLADGSVIEADRQFAYADGSVRLEDVAVRVPPGEDGTGFRMQGDEAAGVEETGEWRFAGSVAIETGDGLAGRTAEASYADATGVVTMPAPSEFEQGWMRLAGDVARYERRRGLLHLDRNPVVVLQADGAGETSITAGAALIARRDGYMRFTGGVRIDSADWRMRGASAVIRFDPDGSRIDALDLESDEAAAGPDGAARIAGVANEPGRLRQMTARSIGVTYEAGAIEGATLAGDAEVELFGPPGGAGTRIASRTLVLSLADGGFGGLSAAERVSVELPAGDAAAGGGGPRIAAGGVEIAPGAEGEDGWRADFDGDVEFREPRAGGDDAEAGDRVLRSARLEAGLGADLARLDAARFIGDAQVEDGALAAVAHEAAYDVAAGTLTLAAEDESGDPPRVDDGDRGTTQARTVTLTLDGGGIEADGQVRSVLAASAGAEESAGRRPGFLAADERVFVAADRFTFDPEESVATYSASSGTARLWQDAVELVGTTITLHEATGSLRVEGQARSRMTIAQKNDETGEEEALTTIGGGESMEYDDEERRLAYEGGARFDNPRNDLSADAIEVFLQDDARTLDRIRAEGGVTLRVPERRVTGETMVYDDADGRYEMEGEPVEILERTGEDACRQTTARSLTFFLTDEVRVDGDGEGRTSSSSDACHGLDQ